MADEIRADLIQEERDQQAKKAAKVFLESAQKAGTTMVEQSRSQGLPLKSTGFFKRGAQIPQIGYAQEISQAAFLLTGRAPLAENALKGTDGYYVIRLKERREPPAAGFEAQRDGILQSLQRQKEQRAFGDWLSRVKAESQIEIEEEFLE